MNYQNTFSTKTDLLQCTRRKKTMSLCIFSVTYEVSVFTCRPKIYIRQRNHNSASRTATTLRTANLRWTNL